MTATQGRLTVRVSDPEVTLVGHEGVIATVYDGEHTSDVQDNASELARRWNAFEDGGAVALAIEALREFINFAPRVRSFESENESIANGRPLMASQSEYYIWLFGQAEATLAALTEEAGT